LDPRLEMAGPILSDEMTEFDGDGDDGLRERFENIAGLLRAHGIEVQSNDAWWGSIAKWTGSVSDV
jgi:hypothetical protein